MNTQTIQQAISFLTTPLSRTTVPINSVDCLQSQLFAAIQARTRSVVDPSLVLRLSSSTPPPDFIAFACESAGIDWQEWIFLLGGGLGLDLDVYIHPGTVNVCFRKFGCPSSGIVTVWQQSEEPKITTKELLAYDDDSDLFTLINQKVHSPSWVSSWTTSNSAHQQHMTKPSSLTAPVMVPKLQPVPASARHAFTQTHSRSSSYASSIVSSSSSSSASYRGSSNSSNASGSPPSSTYSLSLSEDADDLSWRRRDTIVPGPAQSAIMAARQAHALKQQQQQQQMPPVPVMVNPDVASSKSGNSNSNNNKHRRNRSTNLVTVDTTKANVTAYDGGKTRVITGGVMLGPSTNTKKRC